MSQEKRSDEAMFRRYLLGELNETEQEAFERELMTSDELFQELLIVEDEVVDDFLAGELSASQEGEYRKRFLSTLERRRQHRFGAALRKHLRRGGAKKPVAPSTDRNLARLFPSLWRPVLAAAMVALVAAGLWWIVTTWRSPFRLEQTAEGVEGPTVAFFLPRGSLRSTEPETSFTLPPGVNFVELQLDLPAGARGDHDVTLENPRSGAILAKGTLPARNLEGQQVVVAIVPSELLSPGDYRVVLRAVEEPAILARYEFRVQGP